jgi:CRP/FNR family cyclic AMP-dependent transcriptional regulator
MTTMFDIAAALKTVPLFSTLSDSDLAAMLPAMQHRTYPARACIVRSGESADGLHVLLTGRARLHLDDGNGHEIIVAEYSAGDVFGEIGLIDASARFADVQAQQPCEILFIPRKAALEWLQRDPVTTLWLLSTVLQRLGEAYRKIGNLALVDVYGRVARVLLESGRDVKGEWLVEPGSEQIAAMVGASREMVSRVVKNMINQGLVRRYKRKLIVLDRAALSNRNGRTRSYRRETTPPTPLTAQSSRSPHSLA